MSPNGADKYRQWDAAYVLGSLGRLERREFEQHLAGCAGCRAAVAEFAGLPSLLDALTPQEAQALGPTGVPVPAELPPGLAEKVRRRRQRTRLAVAGLVLGASAASGAATATVTLPERPAVQSQTATVTELNFTPVVNSAPAAKGSITGQAWGTRIDWECRYALSADGYPSKTESGDVRRTGPGEAAASEVYNLVVVDSRGVTTQVASWTAGPGTVVTPAATTSIRREDIRQVEIRAAGTGTVLLTARP
ncbi:anti-sigma factor family protein [Pseudarthrobacter sp. H2]|uniref:anti-sigma factor family protein n=1 Tax=Pseudarthrobacter sp. H2 TaxID=3418415 RepID=UPI003CF7F483